ncbi:MAG: hypothetical protein EOM91_07950 [Sphingobacteriia bacterium]|nr:hypothetical protein [Sphingobacteriia bacterium]NCC39910.1 hypothetical protein [Gammaproteobacteria bacterium]
MSADTDQGCPSRIRRDALMLLVLLGVWVASGAHAQGGGPVWGMGIKPCADFLLSAPADPDAAPIAGANYRAYREWLAGFVTGLNLATGQDVLHGAALDAAMIRIRSNCERHPEDDVFNAALRLLRTLGS